MKIKQQNRRNRNRIQRSIGGAIERLEGRLMLAFGPDGPEFRVNTTTAGDQRSPAVAMDATGGFLVSLGELGAGRERPG